MTMTAHIPAGIKKIDSYQVSKDSIVEKYQLENGLKIIVFEDHSAPVFAYHTWFNVGSRNERDGITGIAHLFEHLMFKETKNTKEGVFDRTLEEQGGKINAGTYLDWTFYRESLPKEAFHLIPELEADRMQWMILNDRQINAEREVVANERRMRVDNSPDGQLNEELYKTAFTKHPYHWPVIGWMKDIQSISVDDCVQFYKQYYAPNNATLVIVGDVNTQEVLREVDKHYSKIPSSVIAEPLIYAEEPQLNERAVKLELTISEEKLLIGYHFESLDHPMFNALSVLNGILFEGHSARLFRKLISDTNMASEVFGSVDHTKDPGLYVIQVSMSEGFIADEALKVIDDEIENLFTSKISQQELDRAINRVETMFWSHFGTADEKAQNIGFYETVLGDFKKLFHEVDALRKVTPEEIYHVAKTYLKKENRTLIYGLPKSEDSSLTA